VVEFSWQFSDKYKNISLPFITIENQIFNKVKTKLAYGISQETELTLILK
jgi:hypothetical protein